MENYALIVTESDDTISYFNSISHSKFELLIASSIEEAEEFLVDDSVNIIVTFVENILENRPGIQILKQLREVSITGKFIMMLNSRNINIVTNYMKAGAYDCISKPFSADEIYYKLEHSSRETHFEKKFLETIVKRGNLKNQNALPFKILNEVITKRRAEGFILNLVDILTVIDQNPENDQINTLKNDSINAIDDEKEIKRNILVIEDEPDWQENLSVLLETKYNVFVALDAATGLSLLQANDIDVVLLDIRLPDANGMDLLKDIKRDNKETEVIMVTAFDDMSFAIQCIQDGAFDYINKPYADEELLTRISKALENRYYPKIMERLNKEVQKEKVRATKRFTMLKELCEKRKDDTATITYDDIIIFFPEIELSEIKFTSPIKPKLILNCPENKFLDLLKDHSEK
jgi:DNA-binding NtrC family response regulator